MRSLLFCLCQLRNWPQCSAFTNANRTAGLLNLTELEYRVLQGLRRRLSLCPLQNYVLITHRQSNVSCGHNRSVWMWCCKCCYTQPRAASFRTEIMWSVVSVNERFLILTIKLPPYSSLYLLLSLFPFWNKAFPLDYINVWLLLRKFPDKINIFTVKVLLLESRRGHPAYCATGPLCYCYKFSICVLFRNSNFFILVSPLLSLRCYVPIFRQRMNIIYTDILCNINFNYAWNKPYTNGKIAYYLNTYVYIKCLLPKDARRRSTISPLLYSELMKLELFEFFKNLVVLYLCVDIDWPEIYPYFLT